MSQPKIYWLGRRYGRDCRAAASSPVKRAERMAVAAVILTAVEPVRPARRKKPSQIQRLNRSVRLKTFPVYSGRQDAALHGRRDVRRYLHFDFVGRR